MIPIRMPIRPRLKRALIGDEFRLMTLLPGVHALQSTLSAIILPSGTAPDETIADLGVIDNTQSVASEVSYTIPLTNSSDATLQVSLSEDNSGGSFAMTLFAVSEKYETITTAAGDQDVSGLTDAQKAKFEHQKVWVVSDDPSHFTRQSLSNNATVTVPAAHPATSGQKQNYSGSFDTSENSLAITFAPPATLGQGLYSVLLTLSLTSGNQTLMSGKFRLRAVVGGLTFNQTSKATLVQKTHSQIPITIGNPFNIPMVADVYLNPNAPQGLVISSSQRILVKPLETVQVPIQITVTTEAKPTAAIQIPLTITTGIASD